MQANKPAAKQKLANGTEASGPKRCIAPTMHS